MSSRQSRKQASSTTSRKEVITEEVSTPASSTKSPGRRARPASPTVISRLQEKQELSGLNDRLAAYIDKVRSLEAENRQLTKQITTYEETTTKEISSIKDLYEQELADARKLMDDLARSKAELQIEVTSSRESMKELKDKLNRVSGDLTDAEKKLLKAEAQVNDLQAKLSDAVGQKKHWENAYHKLKPEYDSLEKQMENLKRQLELETVKRVDQENRYQTLKEELAFQTNVHQKELNETKTRTEMHMEEVDSRMQAEMDSIIRDQLQELRDESEQQILQTREETETVFLKKLDDLKNRLQQRESDSSSALEEVKICRTKINSLSGENTKLKNMVANYETRIKDLEESLDRERQDHKEAIDKRDAEIARLRETLEEQLQEYRDLLDVKLALDVEIAAYRKLLEAEETRLNISTSSESTPLRTPARKRKRTGEASTPYSQSVFREKKAGFTSKANSNCGIEVFKTAEDGEFIKIRNKSDKNQSLAGWQLQHKAGTEETVFKFHRSVNIKPEEIITVYSSDVGATHEPPTSIVMKGQRWLVDDNMLSTLTSKDGKDKATMEMTRSILLSSRSGYRQQGDPEGGEKCLIM